VEGLPAELSAPRAARATAAPIANIASFFISTVSAARVQEPSTA
jgi:hypothetical protein